MGDVSRRFAALSRAIRQYLVEEDSLDLKTKAGRLQTNVTTNAPYRFTTDDQKLTLFNNWLQRQVDLGLLKLLPGEVPWLATYVESAYKKAALRSFIQKNRPSLAPSPDWYAGTQAQFMRDSFAAPEALSKIRLLYLRAFENMKGMTSAMRSQLSMVLADGMANGKGVGSISQDMQERLGVSRERAFTIARTEIVHAHAEGQLDSFERLGVKEVGIMAEWSTAGDDRVCPKCAPLEGVVFTVEEARGLIPRHPNCVLGDSRIQVANPLSLLRAKYFGKVVKITTTQGRAFSVTENHVLLTQRGWIRAGQLNDTDYLLHTPDLHSGHGPDDHHAVPQIGDVFAALDPGRSVGGQSGTYALTPKDLHNDGRATDGKVDIVRVDGFLGDEWQQKILRQFKKSPLVERDIAVGNSTSLIGNRPLASLLVRAAAAADCFMGFEGAEAVLFRGLVSSNDSVRLQLASQGNPFFNQSASEEVMIGQAEPSRHFHHRNPGLVELDHLIKLLRRNDDFRFAEGFTPCSDEAAFLQVLAKTLSANTVPQGQYLAADAFLRVCGDRILHLRTEFVHGGVDVFDVETKETAYLLNGVLSSNCRCAWIPADDTREDEGQVRGKAAKKARKDAGL
jgi:SPP1 gp7 family putative phage head morphogenesis protein